MGTKRKFKVKVNNTNEELFDGLFKQDLGNASSPVPAGAWEGISSSLNSGAGIAGAAVKTALWMKAVVGLVIATGISIAVVQYQSKPSNKPNEAVISVASTELEPIGLDHAIAPLAAVPINSVDENKKASNANLIEIFDQGHDRALTIGSESSFSPIVFDTPSTEDAIPDLVELEQKSEASVTDKQNGEQVQTPELNNQEAEAAATSAVEAINMKDSFYIEVPDAFTADGDGINDTYLIKLVGEESVEIIIYTANNQVIFRTKNKNIGWNSKLPNGDLAPEGFYFVKVIYKYKTKPQSTPIIRRVTLIR